MIVANECTQMPGQSLASAVVVRESSRPVLKNKHNVYYIYYYALNSFKYENDVFKFQWSHSNIDNDTIFFAICIFSTRTFFATFLTIVYDPFLVAWNLDFEHSPTNEVFTRKEEVNNIQWFLCFTTIENNGHNHKNKTMPLFSISVRQTLF